MKIRYTALLAAAILLLCSGCSKNTEQSSGSDEDLPLTYQTSDGATVYSFDGEKHEQEKPGELIANKPAQPLTDDTSDGISPKKAWELLTKCDHSSLHLPCPVGYFTPCYSGTENVGSVKCYVFSFLAAPEGDPVYAGTSAYVSCDGQKIFKKNRTSGFSQVTEQEKDDSPEKPDGAVLNAAQALQFLAGIPEEQLHLEEKTENYTFESDGKLTEIKNTACYCFTPKLVYDNMVRMSDSVYISADNSSTVFVKNKDSDDYTAIECKPDTRNMIKAQ